MGVVPHHDVPCLNCRPAGYGKVYKGRWNSAIVAVKVVEHRIVLMDGAEKVVRLPDSDAVTAADLRDAVAGLVRSLKKLCMCLCVCLFFAWSHFFV